MYSRSATQTLLVPLLERLFLESEEREREGSAG